MLYKNSVSTFMARTLRAFLPALLAAGVLSLATVASAARVDIIDGEGFEPTQYSTTFNSTGQLDGQLADLPGDGVQAAWLASIGTTSTAVVQDSIVFDDDQAVRFDRAANELPGGGRFGVPVTAWPDASRYVCIEWDMRVENAAGGTGAFGPFFGVEAYDDVTVGQGDFGLMGSMGVDATTGDVLYQQAGTGFLVESGATVNFGEWNHFHIDLDFARQEYTIILNGTELLTEGFVDGTDLRDFSDAPLAAFAAAGDSISQALTGTAYFDNYEVYQLTTKIPEPTTLVIGLVALVSATSVSRRRS